MHAVAHASHLLQFMAVTCCVDHVTAAVRMLLTVVNFAKFTAMPQPESKCLFIKAVQVRLSRGLFEPCYWSD